MSEFKTINVPHYTDAKGVLGVLDDILPFPLTRVYWIACADGRIRGGHRHRHTRQALISICGEISVYLNNGLHEKTIKLESSSQCLLVEPEDWHTMTFGPQSILLVLASHPYDRDDYIDVSYG
jgi:hypothetical protein